ADQYKWEQTIRELMRYCESHISHKRHKVWQMIQWAEEKQCLRKALYGHFQEETSDKAANCCSNCAFTLNNFHYTNTNDIRKPQHTNWQRKLQAILLTGEKVHETSRNN